MKPRPIAPQLGQESVWDYPRPPRLEPVVERIRVVFGGVTIVETDAAIRVLETSHPPNYYLPPDAFGSGVLVPAPGSSVCEWKGRARYFDIVAGGKRAASAGWSCPDPTQPFRSIRGFVALYAGPMDACFLGYEQVVPQPGGFYGGWITSGIVGPFKGGAGTMGW